MSRSGVHAANEATRSTIYRNFRIAFVSFLLESSNHVLSSQVRFRVVFIRLGYLYHHSAAHLTSYILSDSLSLGPDLPLGPLPALFSFWRIELGNGIYSRVPATEYHANIPPFVTSLALH